METYGLNLPEGYSFGLDRDGAGATLRLLKDGKEVATRYVEGRDAGSRGTVARHAAMLADEIPAQYVPRVRAERLQDAPGREIISRPMMTPMQFMLKVAPWL